MQNHSVNVLFKVVQMHCDCIFFLELEVTARLDVQVRVQSLYAKLVSQGRKYASTENYFPIGELPVTCHLNELPMLGLV